MVIYLVRHGKDDERYRGGWSDLGLIEEGRIQAELLAEYVSHNKEKYVIDTLISSDLRRAVETTKYLEEKLDISAELSSEWRETNNGILAGMLNSEALQTYPDLFFNSLKMDERYPGGESPIEFYNRIKDAYYSLCNKMIHNKIGKNVMIVTHSGVINIIYHLIKGVEWTNQSASLCEITTTGMHKFQYSIDGWEIGESNTIVHLLDN